MGSFGPAWPGGPTDPALGNEGARGVYCTLPYGDRPREPDAVALLARVTVDPDYLYRGLFESLAPGLQEPEARARIQEAHRRTSESSYVLEEIRHSL